MWIRAETTDTTNTMTAVRVSNFRAQAASNPPERIQVKSSITRSLPSSATSRKMTIENRPESTIRPQVISWAPRSPVQRPQSPATTAPIRGRNMVAT